MPRYFIYLSRFKRAVSLAESLLNRWRPAGGESDVRAMEEVFKEGVDSAEVLHEQQSERKVRQRLKDINRQLVWPTFALIPSNNFSSLAPLA